MVDSSCGGDGLVCARDGECLPAAGVRSLLVRWTIHGGAASATACGSTPSFQLYFDDSSSGDEFGFAPVPCMEGQFTLDKLPIRFDQVELLTDPDGGYLGAANITSADSVSFDLQL
jgi:hypothetical protein